MPTQSNATCIQRMYPELQQGNFGIIDELFDPGYVSYNFDAPDGEHPGLDGMKAANRAFMQAFPDMQIVDEDFISEGEKVVHRMRYRATHRGVFLGLAATGRPVEVSGVDIYEFKNGKVVAKWSVRDRLSMLQQLGITPKS